MKTPISTLILCGMSMGLASLGCDVRTTPSIDLNSQEILINGEHLLHDSTTLTGKTIAINLPGRLLVMPGVSLEIKDSAIRVSCGLHSSCPEVERSGILLQGGSELTIKNSTIEVDVPAVDKGRLEDTALFDSSTLYRFIEASPAFSGPLAPVRLALKGSSFTSKNKFSTGLLGSDTRIPVELALAENRISGFHGVISVGNISSAVIERNTLEQNTFAQLGLSGRNILIEDNDILFPGNGSTGDAISLSNVEGVTIRNNRIVAGSCYGIGIGGSFYENILIERNYIGQGVTAAIIVGFPTADGTAKNITIQRNVMARNRGFAVTFASAGSIDVQDNIFVRNAVGFPSQIHKTSQAGTVGSRNNIAIEFDEQASRYQPASSDLFVH